MEPGLTEQVWRLPRSAPLKMTGSDFPPWKTKYLQAVPAPDDKRRYMCHTLCNTFLPLFFAAFFATGSAPAFSTTGPCVSAVGRGGASPILLE